MTEEFFVLWRQAVTEFNEERFFEFHETVEKLWKDEEEKEFKEVLQGLIHIAVCFYHVQRGGETGAKNQRVKAIKKLEKCDLNKYSVRLQVDFNNLFSAFKRFDSFGFPKIIESVK